MMVVSLFLILNFSIGVSASGGYDRQEADACITISQRLSVKGGSDVPNPYGKKGEPAHQKVIESITPKEKRNFIRNEVKFDTTGGTKAYRYADAVEYNKNGEVVAIYQVGKVNKNGTVISRESKAIEDIMNSDDYNGAPIYFLPYNSDIGEIIFDY